MAVCRRSESHGRGLASCTPALSVTYGTAAAAVAACGAIYTRHLYLLLLSVTWQRRVPT